MNNDQCVSSLKEVQSIVSYSETDVGQNNDVKIIVMSNENESAELVVERFSSEEIDIINNVLKKFKDKLFSDEKIENNINR